MFYPVIICPVMVSKHRLQGLFTVFELQNDYIADGCMGGCTWNEDAWGEAVHKNRQKL
jgi:hypothetical protein